MVYFFASGMYYYAGSKDQLIATAPDDAEETIVCPVQVRFIELILAIHRLSDF